eukprot:CAMPEP_0170526336 /NCGR_PEP_ID=MMETSP0209-20121228/11783_1 /TAXON_ID=665100 ORGANISM="Litonotus pictus, Strain P1" /NCGR_SAMPLE_ID=MMETSP0209 /ASSEMBLY_ACC=CAM_ASM_000301 /LENGTH=434 /DNA_ID=CAMNT_0010816113 /DNA_START=528 /DNA_END=1832 /DNA_ORIENTATION=-
MYSQFRANPEVEFPKCKELDEISSLVHTTISYPNSFINPKDYDNPVVNYDVHLAITLENSSASRYRFELENTQVSTDVGWVLEEISNKQTLTIQKPVRELFIPSLMEKLIVEFESPQKRTKVTRNYLKLQELFAKIGGFFNAINIICNILLYDYIMFKFRVHYSRFALTEDEFKNPEKEIDSFLKIKRSKTKTKIKDNLLGSKKENPQNENINVESKEDKDPDNPNNKNNESETPIKNNESPSRNMLEKMSDLSPNKKLIQAPQNQYNNSNMRNNSENNNKDENKMSMFMKKKTLNNNQIELKQMNKENSINNPSNNPQNQENHNKSQVLHDNYLTHFRTIDIIKVNEKISDSSNLDSIKEVDSLSYVTYVLNRMCSCVYSAETKNHAVKVFISEKTRSKYSFESYLNNYRKFNVFEGYLKSEELKEKDDRENN